MSRRLSIVALAFGAWACGSDPGPTTPPPPPPPPVEITHASLPPAEVGQSYSLMLEVRGESGFSWSVVSGALPASFTLEESGRLSGNPSAPEMTSFRVRAFRGELAGEKDFQLRVAPRIAIVTAMLPAARDRMAYTAELEAIDGIGVYEWSLVAGPGWLRLTPAEHLARLSATAPLRGTYAVIIEVTDGLAVARSELALRVDR